MTTGQLMFYAGIGLFGLTVILTIVFMIKKPKYRPENAAVVGTDQTAPLRNGYPTEPMTIRYDAKSKENAEKAGQATEVMPVAEETILLETEVIGPTAETELLPPDTEILPQDTQLLCEETALLK